MCELTHSRVTWLRTRSCVNWLTHVWHDSGLPAGGDQVLEGTHLYSSTSGRRRYVRPACLCVRTYVHTYVYVYACMHVSEYACIQNISCALLCLPCTGWRRLIGSHKWQIIFHKRATKYRSLLREMTYKNKGSYESSPPCIEHVSKCMTCALLCLPCTGWRRLIGSHKLQIIFHKRATKYRSLLREMTYKDLCVALFALYMYRTHIFLACVNVHMHLIMCKCIYGVATISSLLQIIGLFCRISFLLLGSFAKETYDFQETTNRGHPICVWMH